MNYTVRPISDRTWLREESARANSRFDSSWPATQKLLLREVDLLGGKNLVLEVDVPERGIRLDGQLRADARAATPAVVVAFDSTHGPLLYRCDGLTTRWSGQGPAWQHNVRAVALTLEALRAVDRYGATETGQQYTGFKALPAGGDTAQPPSHITTARAVAILASYVSIPPEHLNLEAASLSSTWRHARRAAHPDRHAGDRTKWDQVEQAAQVLGISS